MFDQHDRPLKREYETLGWQALPQLGQRDRMNRGRVMGIVAVSIVASLSALLIALVAVG
ncbi:hypothetical protein IT881_15100 [Erythrobacter sp. A30-3]|nr:hypothetical protein IT881_15100 [Erythrobacter sp. A30-3]